MWMEKNRVKHLPIGVDLGSSSLKMAQIEYSNKKLELLAAKSIEIPPEYHDDPDRRLGIQAENINHILKSGGFKGHKAILSLPA
ncbi:MAG: hypothetical protein KAV00_12140, partial [Phycisphaerae bacterium]|nr:hypothetical protein [Phycisphaerae bacterium]